MELLNLPEDILHDILQACNRASVLALSLLSSQVNAFCLRHLLHDVHFNRDWSQITSFIAYIINNTRLIVETDLAEATGIQGPGTHVRMLAITCLFTIPSTLPNLWGSDLSKALGLMPNLRSWKTSRYRPLLAASPGLAHILMSFRNLRHLELVDIDKVTGQELSTALTARSTGSQGQMDLETIKVELVRDAPLTSLAACGIGDLLLHNKSSLKEISLFNCDLVAFLSHPQALFPSITSLSLSTYRGTLDILAQSFPHIRKIKLVNPTNQLYENSDLAYSMHAVSSAPRPISFTHLLSIEGDQWEMTPLIEYLGSPRPHLRRIALTRHAHASQSFRTVPQDNPRLSSLHLGSVHLWPDNEWRDLVDRVPHLSFLKFTIRDNLTEDGSQSSMGLSELLKLLTPLPLEYISVYMKHLATDFKHKYPRTEDVALLFARSIPTLQYLDIGGVELFAEKAFSNQRAYWRVARDLDKEISGRSKATGPGLARVTRLDDEDGENAYQFFDWRN